ncbi:DUF3263 domain-containing protein [Pseudarthrobacter sp. LT1]|uniref:DUF3263 domain-containing protein n=1 Tax=Pseudarthrobacter sp. LT1 TaxID=3111450 RepID=UPI002D77E028|nr:DUF3263 domain-containing protein [Pseudarthrobacter sp. LT1]WRT14637.1 DUF3263 domain-containing protein [Pseudarthrobacter sp. LT1]
MLTDRQKAMLNLAGETFKYAGSLDAAAGERFGLSPTRYWQEVNALLRTEAAVAYRPALVTMLNGRRRTYARPNQRILAYDGRGASRAHTSH